MEAATKAEVELARRISRAFREFEGFIYQRELDPPELVGKVVRESGIALMVVNKVLDAKNGIYALTVNDRGCRAECVYGGPCSADDKKCIESCVAECRRRIIERIIEALEKYAERVSKR